MFNDLFTKIDVGVKRKHCKTDVNHSLFPKIDSKGWIVNLNLIFFLDRGSYYTEKDTVSSWLYTYQNVS